MTATQNMYLHSTNCYEKKMIEFKPWWAAPFKPNPLAGYRAKSFRLIPNAFPMQLVLPGADWGSFSYICTASMGQVRLCLENCFSIWILLCLDLVKCFMNLIEYFVPMHLKRSNSNWNLNGKNYWKAAKSKLCFFFLLLLLLIFCILFNWLVLCLCLYLTKIAHV